MHERGGVPQLDIYPDSSHRAQICPVDPDLSHGILTCPATMQFHHTRILHTIIEM